YIDIETGETFLATTQKFLDPKRYRKLDDSGEVELTEVDVEPGSGIVALSGNDATVDIGHLLNYNEVEFLGHVWRKCLQWLTLLTDDDVNAQRITRGLQFSLPFLSGYESFVLGEVIAAFDSGDKRYLSDALVVAFRCRNVSRILVQQMARFDFIFHQHHQFKYNRWYDGFGRIPIIGQTGFPATENFPNTRDFVIGSLFRRVLGEGRWWTRVLTRRQALQTDDKNVVAQNLAAEGAGFEEGNRNQYGTYLGRLKTNEFRYEQRLPTDESIMRTFISTPLSTMINNGVEHVMWHVARHWHNMLYQPYGNFAHQRMEQMNPFEMLRFHMPVILVALSTLRGLSSWDADVLAPFVSKLQNISRVENVDSVKELLMEFREDIVLDVCGGIASRVDLLRSLIDAIDDAVTGIAKEAEEVNEVVVSVQGAIGIGMDLITGVNWAVPSDSELLAAVHAVCKSEHSVSNEELAVSRHAVRKALNLLSPKDMRTLIELCNAGQKSTTPAKLLARRTVTLLQRELRRDALDFQLRELSKGPEVATADLKEKTAYWLLDDEGTSGVYVYEGKQTGAENFRFTHIATHHERWFTPIERVEILQYIEVAEIITRAQHAFMTIELDYGKKFSYDGFMEFEFLREPLRQLLIISQVHCSELDDAKMNVLQSIRSGFQTEVTVHDMVPGETYYTYTDKKEYEPFVPTKPYSPSDPQFETVKQRRNVTVPPQSLIVIGGGPTGLLTALHCLENVLRSDGYLTLYESRDAFAKAGATFERSQIVRLDPRWIAMLRYHLGTIYEDEFVPLSGETDPHFGNTLPTQGFIEITIKDIEALMNLQVAKLASRGLLRHDTNAGCQYDVKTNQIGKLGAALKPGDLIHRDYDPSGRRSTKQYTWEVTDLVFAQSLSAQDLVLGDEYAMFDTMTRQVINVVLVGVHITKGEYVFQSLDESHDDVIHTVRTLPSIYKKGTKVHGECEAIVIKSILRDEDGSFAYETLPFSKIGKMHYTLDVGHCHVAEAIGKPRGSSVHFEITTEEPYGVCCLSGLKVSMGMHNLGTRRWHTGFVDDIRSHTDQNTRVIGDFTKTVNSSLIVQRMVEFVKNDPDWRLNLEHVVAKMGYGEELSTIWTLVCAHVSILYSKAPYVRTHLQTRFFETGDNFYLGMEFTREYDIWKKDTVTSLLAPIESNNTAAPKMKDPQKLGMLRSTLENHLDRLWYDACLETIRLGDVYNPGGQSFVPRMYLLDSLIDVELGTLPVGDCFRLSEDPSGRYEVLVKHIGNVVVRDVEGYVSKLSPNTMVRRGSNLTRCPDGNDESKVSIATFPVGHYVNHRTMRLNNEARGYVFAFLGDEQSSPHFMRYSGLTGAAINSMVLNNFIGNAVDKIPFIDRYRAYSQETTWSNGEVVQRGTGYNYGQDGFLAPGFKYKDGLAYLAARIVEFNETGQDLSSIMARNWNSNPVLSRDWKIKFAAAFVPRGMEFNNDYITALYDKIEEAIFEHFIRSCEEDKTIKTENIGDVLRARAKLMRDNGDESEDPDVYWRKFISGMDDSVIDDTKERLEAGPVFVAKRLEISIKQVIEFAQKQYQSNLRISSSLENQPKSADSIIDDFAVDAQTFANSLTTVATLSAFALALQFVSTIGGAIASGLGFWIAVGTITNVGRYKNRNEEWRVRFFDYRYVDILKSVYCTLGREDRLNLPKNKNPFARILEVKKNTFLSNVNYYNYPKATEFNAAYDALIGNMHNPDAIKLFMTILTTQLMVDTYQVCLYLKRDLVDIYQTCEEMLEVEDSTAVVTPQISNAALALLERLLLFEARLDTSLQRGEIKVGAFKERKLKHSHLAGIFQYIWSTIFWANTSIGGSCCALPRDVNESVAAASSSIKPVAVETVEITAQMRAFSSLLPTTKYALSREITDFDSLYYATRESYVSSLVILSSYISLITGFVFSVANIALAIDGGQVWAQRLVLGSSFSFGILTPISSVLSLFYLLRKLFLIFRCDFAVGRKMKQHSDNETFVSNLRRVRWVAHVQEFVTTVRATASAGSAVALPWALAASQGLWDDRRIPLLIALISVGMQILSIVFLFLVEYSVLYNLDPKLGEYVCVAFDDELQQLKHGVNIPTNQIQTQQVQERTSWEYVARIFLHRYRFDTVFAANRFGSVLQYIQSGLHKRSD
ncbi:unnamed protein product, partial [Ectocarpus fasciculatus]